MKLLMMGSGLAMVSALWFAGTASVADRQEVAPDESTITVLLTERREVLKKRQRGLEQLHRMGDVRVDDVLRASHELLDAELALTENREKRIALRQQQVGVMKKLERAHSDNVDVGISNPVDLLTTRAARLQAEVKLEREKIGAEIVE